MSSTGTEGSLGISSPIGVTDSEQLAEDDALKRAVEELFVRCEQRVGRYLAQMVRDRALAEDLLQDSFHDALRSRADLPLVRNHEAWLYGIARNRALAALRKRRRFAGALGRLAGRRQAAREDEELVAIRDHPDAALVRPLVTRPFSFVECLHTPPMLVRYSGESGAQL